MVRIPRERGKASRLELRLSDASANPYLAIAALLAGALLGIRHELVAPEPLEGYGSGCYGPRPRAPSPGALGGQPVAAQPTPALKRQATMCGLPGHAGHRRAANR